MYLFKFKRLSIHQLVLVILSLVYLSLSLVTNDIPLYWLLTSLALVNVNIYLPIKYSRLIILAIGLLIFGLTTYISTWLFHIDNRLSLTCYLVSRVVALSISSYLFIIGIDFEELIIYLMQYAKLPVTLGYAMLGAINAITNLVDEFKRIKQANLIRYAKTRGVIHMLYPLLVGSVRYALQLSIALESRGLTNDKSYLYIAKAFTKRDLLILIGNIAGILIIYYIVYKLV